VLPKTHYTDVTLLSLLQFGEPKDNVAGAAGYDLYSPPWERVAVEAALQTWKPALTGRFKLLQAALDDGYSVVLYHPGTELPDKFGVRPRDLSNMVVHIQDLLYRAARYQSESLSVYLYDTTAHDIDSNVEPEFLSGLEINVPKHGEKQITVFPETEYVDLLDAHLFFEHHMAIGGRRWTVVVVPVEGTYEPNLTFVVLCGVMIFGGSLLLGLWLLHNMRKTIQMNRIVSKAAAEASIVSNLFPANVLERMIADAEEKNKRKNPKLKDTFINDGKGHRSVLSVSRLNKMLTSEGIFGRYVHCA